MLRTLRPALVATRASAGAAAPVARALHSRVELPYPIDAGLDPFLSHAALKMIAVDWQQGVLDRLNELVRGTQYADLSVLETVKQTASDPSQTLAFNYASEALNNSFFLSTLSPNTPTAHPERNSAFSSAIARSSLESFPALISHFSAHVSGLHPSSGAYVWLATDQSGNVGVLGTYAGGTLLMHQRQQMGDLLHSGPSGSKVLGETLKPVEALAASGSDSAAGDASPKPSEWTTVQPDAARNSRQRKGAASAAAGPISSLIQPLNVLSGSSDRDVGRSILPLACVSLHPHCYLADYGVWGREEYVRQWFGAVDWKKVEASYEKFVKGR